MTEFEIKHGLSQDAPGPIVPVEVAQQSPAIRVEVEADPRGVNVGVWDGSRCVYSGAHAVPGAPAAPVSTVEQGDAQDEQAAFEDWMERTCPSGDVEAVQRQWEASSDYADFHAPAAGDARDALRELVACDNIKKQIASMQVCVLETDDDVQELDAMMSDLARRQPAAWDAARAAIAQQSQRKEA